MNKQLDYDATLKELWEQAMEKGVFGYRLNDVLARKAGELFDIILMPEERRKL